jgi:3-carboxy-cis,cis-muconate cycloisomerase
MAASIVDSSIFQGIFSSEAMRQVWSDENRTSKYLEVERALAVVQGRLGLIPQEAADEIVSHCRLDQIDMACCASRPSASAIPCSVSCPSSTRCAATG